MANLFILPFRPAYDGNAKFIPGAQLYFTLSGTNTLADVYADDLLTTPLASPVVANALGRFPSIYLDEAVDYRARVYDADATVGVDTPIEEYDPYDPGALVLGVPMLGDILISGAGISITEDPDAGTFEIAVEQQPETQTVVSAATVTPLSTNDLVAITAQAVPLMLADPSGTAGEAWGLFIRIKDNGTARAITYGSKYRAIGVTLPTTTVAGKTLYIGASYNAADDKWDVLSVAQQA